MQNNLAQSCHFGTRCRKAANGTCRFRHFDYCVQYYLFGRCGCSAKNAEILRGHVSKAMYHLALTATADTLQGMQARLLQENAEQERIRVAQAQARQKEWEEDFKRRQLEAERKIAENQALRVKACEERLVLKSIPDFLRCSADKWERCCQHNYHYDGLQLFVHVPSVQFLHNVKLWHGLYSVCGLCMLAMVVARPHKFAFTNLIPARSWRRLEQSPDYKTSELWQCVCEIRDTLNAYEARAKAVYQTLLADALCRDVATIVFAYLAIQ